MKGKALRVWFSEDDFDPEVLRRLEVETLEEREDQARQHLKQEPYDLHKPELLRVCATWIVFEELREKGFGHPREATVEAVANRVGNQKRAADATARADGRQETYRKLAKQAKRVERDALEVLATLESAAKDGGLSALDYRELSDNWRAAVVKVVESFRVLAETRAKSGVALARAVDKKIEKMSKPEMPFEARVLVAWRWSRKIEFTKATWLDLYFLAKAWKLLRRTPKGIPLDRRVESFQKYVMGLCGRDPRP